MHNQLQALTNPDILLTTGCQLTCARLLGCPSQLLGLVATWAGGWSWVWGLRLASHVGYAVKQSGCRLGILGLCCYAEPHSLAMWPDTLDLTHEPTELNASFHSPITYSLYNTAWPYSSTPDSWPRSIHTPGIRCASHMGAYRKLLVSPHSRMPQKRYSPAT